MFFSRLLQLRVIQKSYMLYRGLGFKFFGSATNSTQKTTNKQKIWLICKGMWWKKIPSQSILFIFPRSWDILFLSSLSVTKVLAHNSEMRIFEQKIIKDLRLWNYLADLSLSLHCSLYQFAYVSHKISINFFMNLDVKSIICT